MRTINTTSGPVLVEADSGRPGHVVNTSRVVEEDLTYVDEEPAILAVVSAGDWCAVVEGVAVPMPLWVLLDDGSVYGVVIGKDGLLDPLDSIEKHPHFTGYEQANFNEGVTK